MRTLLLILIISSNFCCIDANPCCGKVDIGPVYTHVKMIEAKKTSKHLDMYGLRGDINYRICKWLLLKPTFMVTWGDGQYYNYGLGVGPCIPLNDKVIVTPSIGYIYSHLKTDIKPRALPIKHFHTTFRAHSFYTGLEACYTFCPCWRVTGVFQYAWAKTQTKMKEVASNDGHSSGPNFAVSLERDINDCWSVNLAAGYNTALSKEKDGTRAYGVKLGITRWLY